MSGAKHTPGPWRIGDERMRDSCHIVAEAESGWDDAANVEAYGGHLICESVKVRNAAVLRAAPDMLEALVALDEGEALGLLATLDAPGSSHFREAVAKARAAIVKGDGGVAVARKHVSEMTENQMHAMQFRVQDAAVKYVSDNGFSGLSHLDWFDFYSALQDAVEDEWRKATKRPKREA